MSLTTKVQPVKVATHVFRNYLNGVFCIYKPTGIKTGTAVKMIEINLLKELNKLPAYEHEVDQYFKERFSLPSVSDNNTTTVVPTNVPQKITDFSKHKLVLGDMFVARDLNLKCHHRHRLGSEASGVVVCSVGRKGGETLNMIRLARYLRVYHVKGRLGYCTDNFFPTGKFIERTTYAHINKGKLDKYCGSAQSSHRRFMFEYAGVDSQSEEAYELACQGLVRPADDKSPPMIYGLKCIYFDPPEFTLEVHTINETTEYLGNIVNDIGLKLKSSAVCTHVHRLRYGVFDLDYALLKKEWHLPHIVKNITKCMAALTPDKLLTNLQFNTSNDITRNNESGWDGGRNEGDTRRNGVSVDDIVTREKEKELEILREQIKNFSRK
ncbi:tRNA pseudouridine synthase 2 [Mactra antiquata]